ncbi:hypothetical protein [Paenibacillus paeoniae]|uniref:DUF4083 domain-containing protein n=1 Tax=Paenibacillus paeoniae TaxID=2292705 RepID=A0A371PKC3_9BACL|nr:hypothetical protein [Paenibacillus paeoniae]REK76385.1 hypothetical protein DX130_04905 [Paenibacillus paeoniae]
MSSSISSLVFVVILIVLFYLIFYAVVRSAINNSRLSEKVDVLTEEVRELRKEVKAKSHIIDKRI